MQLLRAEYTSGYLFGFELRRGEELKSLGVEDEADILFPAFIISVDGDEGDGLFLLFLIHNIIENMGD